MGDLYSFYPQSLCDWLPEYFDAGYKTATRCSWSDALSYDIGGATFGAALLSRLTMLLQSTRGVL